MQSPNELQRIRDLEDDAHLDRLYGKPIVDPDPDAAAEEARQAEIWAFIESGDLISLAKILPK